MRIVLKISNQAILIDFQNSSKKKNFYCTFNYKLIEELDKIMKKLN